MFPLQISIIIASFLYHDTKGVSSCCRCCYCCNGCCLDSGGFNRYYILWKCRASIKHLLLLIIRSTVYRLHSQIIKNYKVCLCFIHNLLFWLFVEQIVVWVSVSSLNVIVYERCLVVVIGLISGKLSIVLTISII